MKTIILTIIVFTISFAQNTCEKNIPHFQYQYAPDQTQDQWDYETQNIWGQKFESCARPVQSPIDLKVASVNLGNDRVKMDFKPDAAIVEKPKIINNYNGNQYRLSSADHSDLMVITSTGYQKNYQSQEIQIKVPSEHTLNGYQFDGEIQIGYLASKVQCRNEGPNIAYLSILLQKDESIKNEPFIQTILDTDIGFLPETQAFDYALNITDHVRSFESSYIQYTGTQTTPPCHDVEWIVLSTPKLISTEQFDKLKVKYESNSKWTKRNLQESDKQILLQKGTFVYYKDDKQYKAGDDTHTWAGVWAGSLGPVLVLLILVFIFGMWKLSQANRYKRKLVSEENQEEQQQLEPHQELITNKL